MKQTDCMGAELNMSGHAVFSMIPHMGEKHAESTNYLDFAWQKRYNIFRAVKAHFTYKSQ